ncbi:MAG TPA: Brp/Blh family beta-carotene 15,15'-dioxygenase [Geodermatophilus sp.]|nr:Brp/Blh family beta-carotene 15,15'-dioxygenase [Geodermatophilus sp.]
MPPTPAVGSRVPSASAPGRRPPPEVLGRPVRAATAVSMAAAGAACLVGLTVPGGWGDAAPVVLVAGLLLGLPHGAVDHLVPGFRLGWRPRVLAGFTAGYAVLAAAGWLAFRAIPGAALLAFVAVSVWHFGSGETAFADLRAGRPVRRRVPATVVVGSLVLLVPLVRGAEETAAVVAAVVPGSGGRLPPELTAVVLGVVLAATAVLAGTLLGARRWLDAAELGVLTALVLVVPPLAAFGVWFGCWHAVRHVARVVAEDPGNRDDLVAGRLGRPLRRFAGQAALPTVVVIVVLALLWSAAGGWRAFVATDVPVLAALTLPHVLVVGWLDRPGPGGRRTSGGP